MTLSALRARLHSLSPAKLAEIEAVSPCAAKILGELDKVLDVAVAGKRLHDYAVGHGPLSEIGRYWEALASAIEALEPHENLYKLR